MKRTTLPPSHLPRVGFRPRWTGCLTRIVNEFGEGVGQTARADVVDGDNRVLVAKLPAAVDDFLRTAFDFRVAALYGVEVQRGVVCTGIHRRSRAAAQADKHTRAAQLDQQRVFGDFVFMRLLR